ncbi:EF hand [Bythopirellula goksoeyrii]|uniref:EF hand n=2 Tax=Bythopirellula goksoeyrii TaxID=1400387 RepID=A0A5B9QF96_9BACT|nr:EF hand [Bythopirellula goksoeyrii]
MTSGIQRREKKLDRANSRCMLESSMMRYRRCLLLTAIVSFSLPLGCQWGPARVKMPDFDPESVAAKAMSDLDSNGDGFLSEDELKGSPGLLASLDDFDQNGDHQLSSEEIVDRLTKWRREKAGLLPFRCEVRWKGKPLKDANIQLVAEPYFDGTIPNASGVSDFAGSAELSCSPDDLPETLKSIRAINPGIYRIEVTHPRIDLPAKYNSNTILGQSVSLRNSNTLVLDL